MYIGFASDEATQNMQQGANVTLNILINVTR